MTNYEEENQNPFIVKNEPPPFAVRNRNVFLLADSLRKLEKNDGYIEVSAILYDRTTLYYYVDQAKNLLRLEGDKSCKFRIKTIKENKVNKSYIIYRVS